MKKITLIASALLLIANFLLPTFCSAQYTQLYEFDSINGTWPKGAVISDGTFLYGMTQLGGVKYKGTIFKIKLDGTGFSKLFDFDSINGSYPYGALFFDGTSLYGMTQTGGSGNLGVIFKIEIDGTGFTKLYDLNNTTGTQPLGSLVSDGTYLYGMTSKGGSAFGTIFKMAKDASSFTVLFNIDSYDRSAAYPHGSLLYFGGFLYGMTLGQLPPSGNIFKIGTNGGYTNLYSFRNCVNPTGSLVSDGKYLYGMGACMAGGGSEAGSIFRIHPDTINSIKFLKTSYNSDSLYPSGSLAYDGDYLYGTGGNAMFKIKPDGTNFKVLNQFLTSGNDNLLIQGDYMYGMTADMGKNYGGTIFMFAYRLTLPIVKTDSIANITTTTGDVYGNLLNNGADTNTYSGFCYSTSPTPTIANSIVNGGYGQGAFAGSITGLNPNITYYVRAYATNAAGTSYGSQLQFKTKSPTLPIVTTDSIVNITATRAIGYGNLTNDGNDPNAVVGFCYNTSPNPSITDNTAYSYNNELGVFPSYMYNLNPNTTYYVKAFSTNAAGTSYGSQLQFTTGNATLPVVTTDSIIRITATTAYAYGKEINNGNDPGASTGFCFNAFPNPAITDTSVYAYVYGTGSFNTNISGLKPNTVYYVRAYSTNVKGTSYGNQLQFTTGNDTLPIVTTDSISNITATSAYGYGTIINNGNDPNATVGFCFNTSPNPTLADSTVNAYVYYYNNPRSFSTTISSLKPNTVYYVKAFSTNAAGTSYGTQLQFTTSNATLPIVTTDSINNITATTAQAYGNLINRGNDPNASVGFCFNTSPNPTIADSIANAYAYGTGSFSASTSYYLNLNPNTTYYVRAYATNAKGTSYGNQIQFTTSNCFAYYTTTYDTLQNAFTSTVDSLTSSYAISYKWDFGDGTFSTSPSPHHVYAYNGTYQLNMKIYTSSGDSCEYSRTIGKDNYGNIYRASGFVLNVINSNATFISQNEAKENGYTIIPNPTSSIVNVVFSQMVNNVSVRILNIAGQKIIEQNNLTGNKFSFDLSNQASGLYILEVNENGIITRNKLLKK